MTLTQLLQSFADLCWILEILLTRIFSFWTQGKVTRGQTPLAGVIALIGLCVHACVWIVGFLGTQGKATRGQLPLAGVIGLCVHACVSGFVFGFLDF